MKELGIVSGCFILMYSQISILCTRKFLLYVLGTCATLFAAFGFCSRVSARSLFYRQRCTVWTPKAVKPV